MQMGKFPKPCEKRKEMCSLGISVSPLSLLNLTPITPAAQVQAHGATGSLCKKMGQTPISTRHLLAGRGYLLFILENPLYGKAAFVRHEECGYLQAKQQQQQL